MRSSRLYTAKLSSMPKLEFAISESPTSPPRRIALPTRSFVSSCSSTFLFPFPVPPYYTSLISSIDRKYKVVIPELIYLTLAAYRKVPSQSAKWIRERKWIAGYAKDLSLSTFSFFSCSLRTCGR